MEVRPHRAGRLADEAQARQVIRRKPMPAVHVVSVASSLWYLAHAAFWFGAGVVLAWVFLK